MNGTEQRAQGTRTGQLSKQLEDQGLVIEALAGEIVFERKKRQQEIDNVETALRLNDGLRDHLSAALGTECAERTAFESRTFWQRLRWFVTGR